MVWDVDGVDEPFGTPPLGTEGPGRTGWKAGLGRPKKCARTPGANVQIPGAEKSHSMA